MRLSELKTLVDAEVERLKKYRQDPEVLLIDFRSDMTRPVPICEEARPLREATTLEGRTLESACSDLHWDEIELKMVANHAYFCLIADDTKGIL